MDDLQQRGVRAGGLNCSRRRRESRRVCARVRRRGKLHIHRDVGVCSIEHNELTAVLLLRHQRGHAAQPVPRLWNGRKGEGAAPACRGWLETAPFVHLSSLVEGRSRACSFEKPEVELDHDQLDRRRRIAWVSERLGAGAAPTTPIRPYAERALRATVLGLGRERRRIVLSVLRVGAVRPSERSCDLRRL